jgi:hypothetical protein
MVCSKWKIADVILPIYGMLKSKRCRGNGISWAKKCYSFKGILVSFGILQAFMKFIVSAVGFLIYAGAALVHFLGLSRIAAYWWPNLGAFPGICFVLLWLGSLAMLFWGVRKRLEVCFGLVFLYVMVILIAGTQVLPGVPSKIEEGNWRDPKNLLTPQSRYVLHNHSVVQKVLSQDEFELYSNYVACYFGAAGILFGAVLFFGPFDRNNFLGLRRRPLAAGSASHQIPTPETALRKCRHCNRWVPAEADGHWPPWCHYCGKDMN